MELQVESFDGTIFLLEEILWKRCKTLADCIHENEEKRKAIKLPPSAGSGESLSRVFELSRTLKKEGSTQSSSQSASDIISSDVTSLLETISTANFLNESDVLAACRKSFHKTFQASTFKVEMEDGEIPVNVEDLEAIVPKYTGRRMTISSKKRDVTGMDRPMYTLADDYCQIWRELRKTAIRSCRNIFKANLSKNVMTIWETPVERPDANLLWYSSLFNYFTQPGQEGIHYCQDGYERLNEIFCACSRNVVLPALKAHLSISAESGVRLISDSYKEPLDSYLVDWLLEPFKAAGQLQVFLACWKTYCKTTGRLERTATYLDRFHIPRAGLGSLKQLATWSFTHFVFAEVKEQVCEKLHEIIALDRAGSLSIDRSIIRKVIKVFKQLRKAPPEWMDVWGILPRPMSVTCKQWFKLRSQIENADTTQRGALMPKVDLLKGPLGLDDSYIYRTDFEKDFVANAVKHAEETLADVHCPEERLAKRTVWLADEQRRWLDYFHMDVESTKSLMLEAVGTLL
mmetsp:Transcript_52095/g.86645  ORF Transcript_52095/g.86645 Transcript_52095/m.86645 type:complete len:516 (-) Transcript_52095:224-1771(-)